MKHSSNFSRRRFLSSSSAVLASAAFVSSAQDEKFAFRYIVGASMYGELPLAEILVAVNKTRANPIDIWPRKHGSQREQVEGVGVEAFAKMLEQHDVKLGCSTRYDLGRFGLQEEMKFVQTLGGDLLICGGKGPNGLQGDELKKAVKVFGEELKPHADAAGEAGVRIGIENHANNLIDSADSLQWLVDFGPQVAALKKINFTGYTENFMHPVPRGIPILPTAAETTDEIICSRDYLEKF